MVTLDKLREDMRNKYAVDKEIRYVEVMADTIDECLADAAVQLDSKVSNLQYEIVERGSDGFLGMGKKHWTLKIYQDPTTVVKAKKLASDGLVIDEDEEEVTQVQNRDGLFYVRHFASDIVLKVVPAIGEGIPVDIKEVIAAVKQPDTLEIDESLIKKYVKTGTDGEYNVIGQYKHVQAGDALVSVDVTKDEMKASIIVSPPGKSGAEASPELIVRSLQSQGVIEQCIDLTKIYEFVDNPVYNIPFEVAAAIQPVDGQDAYLSYNFEIDPKKLKAKVSETGQINYHELNQIQNVISDQIGRAHV